VAADTVVMTVVEGKLRVLLIERGQPPFEGTWALPGGFVEVSDDDDQGEDLDSAAARELHEETGLSSRDVFLEQLRTFGRPGRDPRGRVISVTYYALVAFECVRSVSAGDDAAKAEWFEVGEASRLPLAFDHRDILQIALGRIRERIDHDLRLASSLVGATFTKKELRGVYEGVAGQPYDKSNFNKRFNRMIEDGIIVPTTQRRSVDGPGRPAQLFAFETHPRRRK
jgi:8-oxo-dGTP diphosphatase